MRISSDVIKWLRKNVYAVKNGEYWFLTDFPEGQIPDKLEIPINKRLWESIMEAKGK